MISVDNRQQTLSSFDWQWAHLPSGDFMPGDAWFDANAADLLARELCAIDRGWFAGKRALDAGCGQGRWSRALLEMGADVTAIDYSEAGLARTRELCGGYPRLRTRQVDLLSIPKDLATQRFDLVYSFGVLHHTGDTWRALDNVARLVADDGALVLYLYGSTSWEPAERAQIERVREELAALSFDAKIAELRRRYPGQDPHQLFDLLSPVINDRVSFDDVSARLQELGFDSIARTIANSEVYVRATRSGFPAAALTPPVGPDSLFARESAKRWQRRSGAAFEGALRARLAKVGTRPTSNEVLIALESRPGATIFDASLPPDRIEGAGILATTGFVSETGSPAEPGALSSVRADVVVSLGGSLGACRFPTNYLLDLWRCVTRGGLLIIELPETRDMRYRWSLVDRVLDARRPVPEKVARTLRRHGDWSTGRALYTIGGSVLLNPIDASQAADALARAGAARVESRPSHNGAILLIARSAA